MGLRTGDTSLAERQRHLRKPPHVLITTPESLNLLLTSKARAILTGVTHCIVDEIHALCPNKRGVFLSLLLERLQALNPRPFVRIGLSATQRPLDEVARYLGGFETDGAPRPVEIIDAGLRKAIDLEVLSPVEQFGAQPEKSIWPAIYRLLAKEVLAHRSTIIFANNRRTVERVTAMVNEELQTLDPDGVVLVRAHHGSINLEVRQQTEQALKEGRLRGVVATASLELGIDMGAVDLVCQVESTGNVARALQRVGRAGHLVGQKSKGRLIPKILPDLLNQAVLAAEMLAGRVEALRVPRNCLDVLAQQVVAMVAMDSWPLEDLFRLVRQAYPYRDLAPAALDAVLEMISGRFRFNVPLESEDETPRVNPATQLSALQPRISWDRIQQKLHALPGSQRLAVTSGGTIPDMGHFAVYTEKGVRIGELDEEFIFERRVGDAFLLGTTPWRIERIDVDRVIVRSAEGSPALVPFWHGEQTGRSYDLGVAQGNFLRELTRRMSDDDCLGWLQKDHVLQRWAAKNLREFVLRQLLRTDCVPDHETFLIEASRDPLGDWQVLILSPLGQRFHYTLRLALENMLRQRLGYRPQCLHHDDGILVRLTESDEPLLDLFEGITPDNLRDLVLEELGDSALFALRFRQNAARALLMPRSGSAQRSPLWLQRLRGRDLLQVARRYPDFPIVAETMRECLHDHLDLERAAEMLTDLRLGRRTIVTKKLDAPSPFASALLFSFQMAFMYSYETTEGSPSDEPLDLSLLDQIVSKANIIDEVAIQHVDRRLRGVGQPPRSAAELAEWLRRLGDVSEEELEGPMSALLQELVRDGRVQTLDLPARRWILTELLEEYRVAFLGAEVEGLSPHQAGMRILQRFLHTHALVGLADVLERYPFEPAWATKQLKAWQQKGKIVVVSGTESAPRFAVPENYQYMQRSTLALRRREVVSCPAWQFADFVLRWQKVHPATRVGGSDGVLEILEQLQGTLLPADAIETMILPARIHGYQPRWLDEALAGGGWTWRGDGGTRGVDDVAFHPRDGLGEFPAPAIPNDEPRPPALEPVHELLQRRGALFVADLASQLNLPPSAVRKALWQLVRFGLVTNDQFDVVRQGEPADETSVEGLRSMRRMRPRGRPSRTEARWSLLAWGAPDLETQALAAARRLLGRYGVVSKELAALDPQTPAWRILYEVLSRLELADEVRRGYFVEGLSGAQFALPEAAQMLQDLTLPSSAPEPMILLAALDPANVYGSALELDIPWSRRAGNALVLQAGKPILASEQHGKKLRASIVSADALIAALKVMPAMLGRGQHKMTVETWNGEPATSSPGKELLESAGFVRDYQSMTFYARPG